MYSVTLPDISEDLDKILYKDFSEGAMERTEVESFPSGTLILTADGNTTLYTAELHTVSDDLLILQNCQLVFQKDKTPKIMKFIESNNTIFLLNEQAPSKLFVVRLEAIDNKGSKIEIQGAKKCFSYIYETSLSFDPKLKNVVDFD